MSKRRSTGFTLVEVLISLIVFAIALLALAQIPAVYTRLMSLSVEKENSTLIAINALDYIETLEYSSIVDTIDTATLGTSIDIPDGYTISDIATSTNDPAAPSKMVTVTISRTGGVGKEDVTLTRVVSPFASNTSIE